MTYDNILAAIRAKMDLDTSGTDDEYYSNFYDVYIDECLSVIANTVMPYQAKIEIIYGGKYKKGMVVDKNEYYKLTASEEIEVDGQTLEAIKDGYLYYDTSWKIQRPNGYGYRAKLPLALMSFSEESLPEYISPAGDAIFDAEVLYINSMEIAVPADGYYTIWYNSEYPSIRTISENQDKRNAEIEWLPRNIATLIAPYVASQLYLNDDLTKHTILKNEFETMLSRLDNNKPLASRSINNSSGWTY